MITLVIEMIKLPEVLRKFVKTSQKGFTLIELLVVIGILGILISAMVATIDPFEQINKGRDANIKNISAEFVNGNIRYYTTHLEFPWDDDGADCVASDPSGTALSTLGTCIQELVDEGELKQGFEDVDGLDDIYITSDTTTNAVIACFIPVSKSERAALADGNKYDQTGQEDGTCDAEAGECYWCTR